MEPAQIQAGVAALESELRFILEDKALPQEILAKIGGSGITKLNVFANIEPQEEKLREWIKDDLEIEPRGPGRVITAQLVDAWETARKRIRVQAENDAEARAQGRTRELLHGQQLELRKAYEGHAGEVKDHHYPAYAYINTRLTEFEEGELRAEALDEVVGCDREQADAGDMKVDFQKGTIKLKKATLKGEMPRNAEELRFIYRIMRHHWLVVRSKLPGRKAFEGLAKETFDDLLDHLLGDQILGLKVENDAGDIVAQTTWRTMLRYEHELRKLAIKLVNRDGYSLAAAIKRASEDQELRTKFIVAHLALDGARGPQKRSYQQMEEPPRLAPRADKGQPKGRGKGGKGKNKGKNVNNGNNNNNNANRPDVGEGDRFNRARRSMKIKNMTEGQNPQRVCWNFNKRVGCRGQCNFAHVCGICLGQHSLQQCPRYEEIMR